MQAGWTWIFYFSTMINLCTATPAQEQLIEYGTFVVPPSHDVKGFEEFSIRATMPCTNCRITHAEVQVLDPKQQTRTTDVLLDHIIFCNNTLHQEEEGDRCRGEKLLVVEPGVVESLLVMSEEEEKDDVMQEQRARSRRRAGHHVPSISTNPVFLLTGKLESSSSEPRPVSLSITWTLEHFISEDREAADEADISTRQQQPPQQAPAIYKSSSVRYRRTTTTTTTTAAENQQPRRLRDDIEWWVVTLLIVALSCATLAMVVASERQRLRSWARYYLCGDVAQRSRRG